MTYLLVRQRIDDFGKWKANFDEEELARKAGGSEGTQVFRNAEDSKEVLFLTKWDSLGSARKFVDDTNHIADDAKQTRDNAGLTNEPKVFFLEKEEEN